MSEEQTKPDPFSTCASCVVKDWCKLRSGEYKPPENRIASFCAGYDLLERALSLANVPLEYKRANKHSFLFDQDNTGYKDDILFYLEHPSEFVEKGMNLAIFHNGKGTGKTHTAVSILNEYIYRNCMNPDVFDYERPIGLYVKFNSWANMHRDKYTLDDSDLAQKAHRVSKQMMEVPLLVVDDMGAGRLTPIIRDLFYDIIDHRKENRKATIYTSNLSDATLSQDSMLGEVIMSRVMYRCNVMELGGRDRRKDFTRRR